MNEKTKYISLEEIENYFNSLDKYPEKITFPGVVITDIKKYIEATITILKHNSGKKVFIPTYLDLVKVYNEVKKIKELEG